MILVFMLVLMFTGSLTKIVPGSGIVWFWPVHSVKDELVECFGVWCRLLPRLTLSLSPGGAGFRKGADYRFFSNAALSCLLPADFLGTSARRCFISRKEVSVCPVTSRSTF